MTRSRLFFLVFSLFFVLFSCKKSQNAAPSAPTESPAFSFVSSKESGLTFRNDLKYDHDFNIYSYRNFYNGGGVALGDINNDGLLDVFFTSNMGSNKLFLNKGNLHFDDISEKAGIAGKGSW